MSTIKRVKSPVSGRMITKGGRTYKELVKNGQIKASSSPKRRSSKSTKSVRKSPRKSRSGSRYAPGCSNAAKYAKQNIKASDFCGPEGGVSCPTSFPVNTKEHARRALSYARYAPNPEGIRRCVRRKMEEKGWTSKSSKRSSTSKSSKRSKSSKSVKRTSKKKN
jgi:hypothetical protein